MKVIYNHVLAKVVQHIAERSSVFIAKCLVLICQISDVQGLSRIHHRIPFAHQVEKLCLCVALWIHSFSHSHEDNVITTVVDTMTVFVALF